MNWIGPRECDLRPDGLTFVTPVPPERWPFNLPKGHQEYCSLHDGGLFCDCCESDQSCVEDDPCNVCRGEP